MQIPHNRSALRRSVSLFAVLAALTASTMAQAQDANGSDNAPAATEGEAERSVTYDAAFFAQYAPVTALDIVRRVPGFALEETDGQVRGFSQAAGNVVLNGSRPSSKSESLSQILARIPAGRVVRVEVGPGDLYGSDYAGKNQVLNLIMSAAGGVDGNVKASLRRVHTGDVFPNLEASALIRTGGSTFNLSATNGYGGEVEVGFDAITRLSDGALLERRDKVNTMAFNEPAFALSWAREGAAGRAAHLNLRYAPTGFTLFQTNHVTPAGGPERDDRLEQDYDGAGYEIGGDVSFPLSGGTIKFVALANRRDRDAYDAYFTRLNDTVIGGFEQTQVSRYDEALARLSWAKPRLLGFTAEIGSELAYNRLENATELFLLGAGGARTRIDLPVDQATVDEIRTESYVNLGRSLTSRLRLETRLAFETSSLDVSGDTLAHRSLSYFKPSVTLDWQVPRSWHAQLALRRTVAQLDFFDFISTAELANDRINGGNADLLPQRSWQARFTLDRPVLGRGSIKLEMGHDWVTGLQDRILTPEGFDAPGNLGSGTRAFAEFTFDAPLDSLGLRATRIRLFGIAQKTSVRDPLSGKDRGWSGFYPEWRWEAEIRRDLAKWSYGFSLFDRAPFTFFRIEEEDSPFNSGIFATAFAEFRPDSRTTFRLDADNALNTAGQRLRRFYLPNRSSSAPSTDEFRRRNNHVSLTFSINRTFGGSSGGSG